MPCIHYKSCLIVTCFLSNYLHITTCKLIHKPLKLYKDFRKWYPSIGVINVHVWICVKLVVNTIAFMMSTTVFYFLFYYKLLFIFIFQTSSFYSTYFTKRHTILLFYIQTRSYSYIRERLKYCSLILTYVKHAMRNSQVNPFTLSNERDNLE